MAAIAAVTFRVLRAVIENARRPRGRRGHRPAEVGAVRALDHRPAHSPRIRGLQAVGDQPRRAAPRGEWADPFRSRVATLTGAVDAVEAVGSSAFNPFTPE